MKAQVVRGSTFKMSTTFYLNKDLMITADLTSATIKTMFKKNMNDADSAALFTLQTGGAGVVVIAPNSGGVCESTLSAAQTNSITYDVVYVECVAKLANGEFIRSGIDTVELKGNILKTLF